MGMKWSVAALLATAAGLAHGQNSVTLYGIFDTGISYYNHGTESGGTSIGMVSLTGRLPTRWGLRGTEDHGGGVKSFFVLESGFQPGHGSLNYGGRLFGSQANVGLNSVTVP